MPTTRSQRARGRGRGRGRGGPASSQVESNPTVPTRDESRASHESRAGASPSGILPPPTIIPSFTVDRVRRHESQRGAYLAFQLSGPVSVRIYSPTEGGQNVECTCGGSTSRRPHCVHIHWLFNRLKTVLDTLIISMPEMGEVISDENMVVDEPAIYGLIESQLPSLPTLINATGTRQASTTEGIGFSADSNTREEPTLDMLSVFDSTALPEEYGRDFAPVGPFDTPRDIFATRSLAETIYRLAVRDELVFDRLRQVVTPENCAVAQFIKLRNRARATFAALDRYVEDGPSEDSQADDTDIPRCARKLRHCIERLCQARDSRRSSSPLSAASVTKVAEILVEILQEVCNRNEDVYLRISWERDALEDEPERNRNLYTYLIDDPPPVHASAPNWMKDTFVIDGLRQIPANEWRHLIERLTSVLDQMREFTEDDEGPTLTYIKLERMIQEYTAEVFEPSSSSAQRMRRPTLDVERESGRSSSVARRPTLRGERERSRRRFE
ncbi:MAG: hypothetical protein LQ350_002230 [Teloschistes chrysophthalmus]|nr:MAG: hypothetical protein LQ350_002230 [Niorma chrysophthalma]